MTEHIREGRCAVRPYIYVGTETQAMIEQAFAGVVTGQFETPIGHHVELAIEDSILILEVSDDFPASMDLPQGSIYIYVPDVDDAYATALRYNCKSIAEPEDKPYDERQAGIKDSSGNTWWVSQFLPQVEG